MVSLFALPFISFRDSWPFERPIGSSHKDDSRNRWKNAWNYYDLMSLLWMNPLVSFLLLIAKSIQPWYKIEWNLNKRIIRQNSGIDWIYTGIIYHTTMYMPKAESLPRLQLLVLVFTGDGRCLNECISDNAIPLLKAPKPQIPRPREKWFRARRFVPG